MGRRNHGPFDFQFKLTYQDPIDPVWEWISGFLLLSIWSSGELGHGIDCGRKA
jgi:hypothetical protein